MKVTITITLQFGQSVTGPEDKNNESMIEVVIAQENKAEYQKELATFLSDT